MSRPWKALTVLLGIQSAVAMAAAALEWGYSCGACRAGGLSLGLVGFAYYSGLFLAAAYAGPAPLLAAGVFFGLGVHLMLVVQLLGAGLRCWICFGAAGLSLTMALLAVAHDRRNLARMAFVLPWSVLLVLGWKGAAPPPAEPPPTTGAVRLTVFTQPGCGYCDELRERVLPEVQREFGEALEVVFRPASDLPSLRRTPTIVIAPARRDRQARVLEGLPTIDALRDAVRDLGPKT